MRKVLMLIDTGRRSGRELIRGITKYANLYGPWVFFHEISYYRQIHSSGRSIYSNENRKKLSCLFKNAKIDGLIADVPDTRTAHSFIPENFPAVLIPGKEILNGFVNMCCNHENAGNLAAEYFLNLGFSNFAFCGYSNNYWSRERFKSYRSRLAEAGYTPCVYNNKRRFINNFWESGYADLSSWLKSLPKPIAIWVWNDDFAESIIDTCRSLDLLIPEEVAVLGADNDELICNLCNPPLSSIAFNHEKVGYEIAETLHKLMKDHNAPNEAIRLQATHVVARQSTNSLSLEDANISVALRFIRENANKPIQVKDVLNRVPLSRRVLYDRFKKVLGRSIYSEIKRNRVELIAKALLTTNDSIADIALKYGFPGVDHVSRYFKGIKGQTPQQYRKEYSK